MRKRELVHLHSLLRAVRDHYERERGEPVATPEYDAAAISPTAIHRSKAAHEEAVQTLLAELTGAVEGRRQRSAETEAGAD